MSEEEKKLGRPTKYLPEYDEQAYNYCLLGATDKQLADFFDTTEQTINAWKKVQPSFLESLKKGKEGADARVASALFHRAIGYEHYTEKVATDQGSPTIVQFTEKFAPDTTAAIFWLKNRRPDVWRDKQELAHTSPDGSMAPTRIEIVAPSLKVDDA